MLITFFRTIVLYILVLIVMRLMGKREIGQLQPFELAISIMIADLATIPMAETGVPITNGIIPILGLLMMHLVISMINIKSNKAREIICGKPSLLIFRGKIDQKVLKKERFTINELEERLRDSNIFNIGDVEYAILETSGQVTVIPKPNKKTLTPEDMNIEAKYEGIPYDLVVDGKVMYKNLEKIGKNYIWLKKQTEKFGIKPEEALIVTIDGDSQFYCQPLDKKRRKVMLKELIISVIIIITIFSLEVFTQGHTKRVTNKMSNNLTNLKEEILREDIDNIKGLVKEIDNIWEKEHDRLAYYIEHDELEKVETSIVTMKGFLDTKNYSSAIAELEEGKFVIEHIKDKNSFNLQNIF